MTALTESWIAVVQRGDEAHEQETELVTLRGVRPEQGEEATIELTDGTRITLVEPAEAA